MNAASEYLMVLITASSLDEAERLARVLIEQKLIACANLVREIQSLFWWQGQIETASEVLLLCKTKAAHFDAIVACITSLHSYETPEIIAMPIVLGSATYLRWIDDATQPSAC